MHNIDEKGIDKRRPNPQPLHAAQIADALLNMRTAAAVSALSVATLYRLALTDPTFPRLVKLGSRCTRIRAGELSAWLKAQGGDQHQPDAPAAPAAAPAAPSPKAAAPTLRAVKAEPSASYVKRLAAEQAGA